MNKKVLITGSSGFIGSNLTKTFQQNKDYVIGIDLVPPQCSYPDEFFSVNIRDQMQLEQIIKRFQPDWIIHLAAVSTIQKGTSNPEQTWEVNLDGTRALLCAIEASGCKPKLLFTSTDKVYGPLLHEKYKETMVTHPLQDSPYDASKAAADALVRFYSHRLPAVVVRLCNIYGPCDTHMERIVPANVRAMLMGQPGTLHFYQNDTGMKRNFERDMLYVDDLCIAILQLLCAFDENVERFCGQVFNLGATECCSMERVIEVIREITNCSVPPNRKRVGIRRELLRQSLDDTKAREWFGYAPSTMLYDGLSKTVNWWRAYLR